MGVSIVAMLIAVSGAAVAATSGQNGDKLIAKGTLSGNRLRNHTVSATQLNFAHLGVVPQAHRARVADSATSAGHAASADNATHATNAEQLGGVGAAGYLSSGAVRRFGPVVVADGGSPTVLRIPPFTVSATCALAAFTGLAADSSSITLGSTEAHSAADAVVSTNLANAITRAGSSDFTGSVVIGGASTSSVNTPNVAESSGMAATPSGKQISFELYGGTNALGHAGECVFGGTVVLDS